MPNYANEGDRVRMPDGTIARVTGGRLVAEATVGSPVAAPPPKMSREDNKYLNDLSTEAAANVKSGEVLNRTYDAGERLGTGPARNLLLSMLTPSTKAPGGGGGSENGGALDAIGSLLGGVLDIGKAGLGAIATGTGVVPEKDLADYQYMRAKQAEAVAAEQVAQKGVQTKSDAAMYALARMSPANYPEANRTLAFDAADDIRVKRARSYFLNKWAAQYGLHGTRPKDGKTAEEVWAAAQHNIVKALFPRYKTKIPSGKRVREVK